MQKKLIFVRHASAAELAPHIGDFDRKLLEKGKDDALLMAKWLVDYLEGPFHIVSSAAVRAKETAQIMAGQLQIAKAEIQYFDQLYMGGLKGYLEVINQTPEQIENLVLVGHNPDIGFCAEYLSEGNIGWMKKCSIVILQIDNLEWAAVSSNTATFVTYNYPRRVRESNL
jgi:phosphohistidine phosphatase